MSKDKNLFLSSHKTSRWTWVQTHCRNIMLDRCGGWRYGVCRATYATGDRCRL